MILSRLVAFFAFVPLLGAVGGSGPFQHRFSPGETVRYKYTYDLTAEGERRSYGGEFQLAITSVEPVVSGTEIRTQVAPAKRGTRPFHIAKDGSLVFAGDQRPSHNYVVYDPRQYCPMPSSAIVGATWMCKTETLGVFRGGNARARIVAADDTGVTLLIDGSAADAPRIERGAGGFRTSRTSVAWHEMVRFKDGLVATILRDQLARTVVGNLTLQTRIRARIERT